MANAMLPERGQATLDDIYGAEEIRRKLFVYGTLRALALSKLLYGPNKGSLVVKGPLLGGISRRIPSLLQQKRTSIRPNVAFASAATA